MDFQVVGTLNLEKEMNYDPEVNPYFSFYLVDKEGMESKVFFKGSKFEWSKDYSREDAIGRCEKHYGHMVQGLLSHPNGKVMFLKPDEEN